MKSVYKNDSAKAEMMKLYEEKLSSLNIPVKTIDVPTSFGTTRVTTTGVEQGEKVIVFHGIHAGAPLTLEALLDVGETHQIIVIDTIGQATKSAETILPIEDDSLARWANEILTFMKIENADFIGVSYGSFILQKLIVHFPEKIRKAIFVVPAGLVNGDFWTSMRKLSLPLFMFMASKKESYFKKFIEAFVPVNDEFLYRFQKQLLLGVNLDTRRPKILTKSDVAHFESPVYVMAASNDVFFPGQKAIEKARSVFKNLRHTYILDDCKHMPEREIYPEIQNKIIEWISE